MRHAPWKSASAKSEIEHDRKLTSKERKKEREREGTKKEKERQRREQVLRKKRVPWETRSMNED